MNIKTNFEINVNGSGWTALINLSNTHVVYSDTLFRNFQYSIPYSMFVLNRGTKPRIKVRQVI